MVPMAIRCRDCALRRKPLFREMSQHEVASVEAIKETHVFVPAGADVLRKGERSRHVYTMYEGWALRYHELNSGARQVLDVMLPGDAIGLASVLLSADTHPVRTLTPASLCVLDGAKILDLFETCSGLALSVLRSRLEDERRVDARLIMLGRMNAEERVSYLFLETYHRLRQRGMAQKGICPFLLRRSDTADAVGLSKVHLMRALRELREQQLAVIRGRELIIPDVPKLAARVGFTAQTSERGRAIL